MYIIQKNLWLIFFSFTSNRNKELESKVAEKDAMIKVLQKRVEEKENLYQSAVRNSMATPPRYV